MRVTVDGEKLDKLIKLASELCGNACPATDTCTGEEEAPCIERINEALGYTIMDDDAE